VTGPVEAVIWAASSAVCTDFTAKLVDVAPCGFARNVCDGISRTNMTPGNPQEVMIKLNPTSNVFKAGHRVRLEIASANFPRFDRNPNTGCSTLTSAETCPALQTILHDAGHPSRIILPVILA
jgi:putative CocE/NonD family hydrolase